jgi:hypothetical protein
MDYIAMARNIIEQMIMYILRNNLTINNQTITTNDEDLSLTEFIDNSMNKLIEFYSEGNNKLIEFHQHSLPVEQRFDDRNPLSLFNDMMEGDYDDVIDYNTGLPYVISNIFPIFSDEEFVGQNQVFIRNFINKFEPQLIDLYYAIDWHFNGIKSVR